MTLLCPLTQPLLRLQRATTASARKQLRNQAPSQTSLHRRACVRARGGNSGYGQLKGRQKGGLNPSIIITTLICNIFMIDHGAPTRISGQALFQRVRFAQPSAALHTARTAEVTDVV